MNVKKIIPGSLRLSYTKNHRLRWLEIVIDPTASADASLTICAYRDCREIIVGVHGDSYMISSKID